MRSIPQVINCATWLINCNRLIYLDLLSIWCDAHGTSYLICFQSLYLWYRYVLWMTWNLISQNSTLALSSEHILRQSDVKGFPIVSNGQTRLLLGYIGRNELRFIIGISFFFYAYSDFGNLEYIIPLFYPVIFEDRAKRYYGATGSTRCSFYCDPTEHDREDIATLATGPAVGIEDEAFTRVMSESATPELLELWPWVNQVCFYNTAVEKKTGDR